MITEEELLKIIDKKTYKNIEFISDEDGTFGYVETADNRHYFQAKGDENTAELVPTTGKAFRLTLKDRVKELKTQLADCVQLQQRESSRKGVTGARNAGK